MKDKIALLSLFFLIGFYAEAQKVQTKKVVVDKVTKLPLEKVNVYNLKDNSITNEEGYFSFITDYNELNFSLIGYENLKLSFEEVNKRDTIFLQSKTIELEEVVVGGEMAIMKKVYAKMKENYILEPYNENFFLRCVLKRNDELMRLQDIYGKVSRKSIFKTKTQPDNKCEVEILNMRKVGIKDKEDFIYFEFQSFEKLFDINAMISIKLEDFELTQEKNAANNFFKISFSKKIDNSVGQKTSGYFIINKEDYAIVETHFDLYDDGEKVPFQKKGNVEYRTTIFKTTSNYRKSSSTNKYYLNNAKSDVRVELLGNEKVPKAFYDYSTNFFVTNSFIAEKAKSNLSMDKDIFKVKYPYSEQFWKSQNQLPLTSDLNAFLKRVSENKDNKKEFEVVGNF
ncbi:carboxypeptidase-like regulatory domain-containing protein [Flavobacterium sp. FlaQc-28]|uniref:carboxypeptidase-like regulatory domain-containing protein n=1 Tax=Flavobacterium sp. FlaQc-28 TaxID=3374178 RepID=UPI003757DDA0